MLVEVARRLQVATRSEDLVARLGGDQFAVLLRPAGRPEADAAVRRLVSVLRGAVLLPDHSVDSSCSVGPVEVRPGRSPEALLHGADTAMHRAKGSGEGHVSLDWVDQDAHAGAVLVR